MKRIIFPCLATCLYNTFTNIGGEIQVFPMPGKYPCQNLPLDFQQKCHLLLKNVFGSYNLTFLLSSEAIIPAILHYSFFHGFSTFLSEFCVLSSNASITYLSLRHSPMSDLKVSVELKIVK